MGRAVRWLRVRRIPHTERKKPMTPSLMCGNTDSEGT